MHNSSNFDKLDVFNLAHEKKLYIMDIIFQIKSKLIRTKLIAIYFETNCMSLKEVKHM